jgi:hypothetical protein
MYKSSTTVNLSYANIFSGDLQQANLIGADMRGTNLTEANTFGGDMTGAEDKPQVLLVMSLIIGCYVLVGFWL